MVSYPSTLPCPHINASYAPPKTFVMTEFEYGQSFRRRVPSAYTMECFFILDSAEMAAFRDFYKNDLADGTLWFEAAWEIEGSSRIRNFHFMEAFTYTRTTQDGGFHKVFAKFLIKE